MDLGIEASKMIRIMKIRVIFINRIYINRVLIIMEVGRIMSIISNNHIKEMALKCSNKSQNSKIIIIVECLTRR